MELYAVILEMDGVEPNTNFVELGGDSLRATILVNAIDEELAVRPELSLVFDSTVSELAIWCDEARQHGWKSGESGLGSNG
jgi:hypothetical protein